MKKKVLALIGVGVLAVSLAACGGGSKAESAASEAASSAAAAASSAVSEAAEAASSAAEEAAPAAEGQGGWKIGYLNPYTGNVWRAEFEDLINQKFEELEAAGVISEWELDTVSDDSTEQLNQFNAMIEKGYDAICLGAVSATAVVPAVEKALDAGILVLVVDNGTAVEGTYFIGNSNYYYGYLPLMYIREQMEEKGLTKLVYIQGLAGNETEIERSAGRDDALAGSNIEIIADPPGQWSLTETQNQAATLIPSLGDEIEAFYAQEGAEGIVTAYENAGAELPEVIQMDYTISSIKYFKENGLKSVVAPSDPTIGATGIRMAVKLLEGKELDESKLQPNPLDENLVNFLPFNPTYCIVPDEETKDRDWIKLDGTTLWTYDEVLELYGDREDTFLPYFEPTDEFLDSFFK